MEWIESMRSHEGEGRHTRDSGNSLVRLDVLLQMVLPAEALATHGTGKGPEASVDALVAGQLFVPREGLATVGLITGERSLAYKSRVLLALHDERQGNRTDLCECVHGRATGRCC